MSRHAYIDLPDGRRLDYEIRSSAKTRSLRLKMTAREGLTVIVPKGINERRVVELVSGKQDWIAAKLNQFDEVRHLLANKASVRPEAFGLPALAESWQVEYRTTRGRTVGARTDQQSRILVYGAVTDDERCKAALRRWLTRRAKETLIPWLGSLVAENGLRFSRVIIKNQRTRWGSCSANDVISLNAKLLFLSPDLVRYVLMHELCHTLERNHTNRFWTLLRQFEPQTDLLHGRMRDAWKQVPAWAHPVQTGREGV
jgi:predicted metal-dependent hydrolase